MELRGPLTCCYRRFFFFFVQMVNKCLIMNDLDDGSPTCLYCFPLINRVSEVSAVRLSHNTPPFIGSIVYLEHILISHKAGHTL